MPRLLNRAQMSVSGTPGTGTITLGSATTGYQSLAAAGVVDGDVVGYLLADGSAWELGLGTYTASGTTLGRTAIRESSNSGAAISATSAAVVSIVALAEDMLGRGYAVSQPGTAMYQFPQAFSAVNGTSAAAANTLYALPIWVSRRQTITKLGLRVTTAAGTNGRVGLYSDHPINSMPHLLQADGGSVSTASTGDKEATVSVVVDPGLYWLVVVCDGAPTLGAGTVASLAHGAATSSSFIRGWSRSFAYGALPADESGSIWTAITSGNAIAPWMRG